MRKRLLSFIFAIMLSLGFALSLGTRTSQACACSCAIVCDNRCQYSCSECVFFEWVSVAAQCCDEAHRATGETEQCPPTGGE
jgi:hypothetical protein